MSIFFYFISFLIFVIEMVIVMGVVLFSENGLYNSTTYDPAVPGNRNLAGLRFLRRLPGEVRTSGDPHTSGKSPIIIAFRSIRRNATNLP